MLRSSAPRSFWNDAFGVTLLSSIFNVVAMDQLRAMLVEVER